MDEQVRRWLLKGREDFKVAKHELSFPEDEISTEAVCFHCQQFVEKSLKAYLVSKGIGFGKTHDLTYLAKLGSEFEPAFLKFDFERLINYAVEVRYPDDFYTPPAEEAREAFELAKTVKEFVFQKLGITDRDF